MKQSNDEKTDRDALSDLAEAATRKYAVVQASKRRWFVGHVFMNAGTYTVSDSEGDHDLRNWISIRPLTRLMSQAEAYSALRRLHDGEALDASCFD